MIWGSHIVVALDYLLSRMCAHSVLGPEPEIFHFFPLFLGSPGETALSPKASNVDFTLWTPLLTSFPWTSLNYFYHGQSSILPVFTLQEYLKATAGWVPVRCNNASIAINQALNFLPVEGLVFRFPNIKYLWRSIKRRAIKWGMMLCNYHLLNFSPF